MRTQFITDDKGKKTAAVVPIRQYEAMLEQLDELACIKAYDVAKAKKNPQFVPLAAALTAAGTKKPR